MDEHYGQKLIELNQTESFLAIPEENFKKSVIKPSNPNRQNNRKTNNFNVHAFFTEYVQECYTSNSTAPQIKEWALDSASTAHIC